MKIPKGVVGSQAWGMHSVHWCWECAMSICYTSQRKGQTEQTEIRRYTDISISVEAEGKSKLKKSLRIGSTVWVREKNE